MEKITTDRNIRVRRNTVTELINDIPNDMFHLLSRFVTFFKLTSYQWMKAQTSYFLSLQCCNSDFITTNEFYN